VALIAISLAPASAQAQTARRSAKPASDDNRKVQEIIVVGDRRSAFKDVAPLAVLGRDALAATGATSMSELLRAIQPLTQSSDGGQPIFLLNGQRTSGYEEIGSLPPEAIETVEVLPEASALKYGYPPTRRVVNFITKRNFKQIEIAGTVGTTTNPGSGIANSNFNLTRLHKDGRLTVALEKRHTSNILQSERDIAPDPDIWFDSIGNVTAPDRGEIDPALSDAAGQTVTVVPVPAADPSDLASYVGAANQPRLFDHGP
jgi:outer membrane receptor protein involved in Fe transport